MLAEMLVSISELLLDEGRTRAHAASNPVDALAALVRWHIDFALHHKALIIVQDRDWSSLPEAGTRAGACRCSGSTSSCGWGSLCQVHPDLDAAHGRTMAHAAFGLINSTPHSTFLDEPAMSSLLEDMAAGSPRPRLA